MLEVALSVLPALIVMILAVFFFDRMTSQKRSHYNHLLDVEKVKHVMPLKIKAYERLIIMIERIKPYGLVMRNNTGQMTAGQLQLELLRSIREEFEHNISLQMYISERAWQAVSIAKEETLQLIKVASSKVQPNVSAMTLSQEIFALEEQVGRSAIDQALKILKLEARKELHA